MLSCVCCVHAPGTCSLWQGWLCWIQDTLDLPASSWLASVPVRLQAEQQLHPLVPCWLRLAA